VDRDRRSIERLRGHTIRGASGTFPFGKRSVDDGLLKATGSEGKELSLSASA